MKSNDLRELSLDEIDAVSGGMRMQFGPVQITAGDQEAGIAFAFSIQGVGGFAITAGGGGCVQLGNPSGGGGVGGCVH